MSSTTLSVIDFFGASSRSPVERLALLEERKKLRAAGSDYSKAHLDYDYFDNPDNPTGYRGYHYDGRFAAAAERMTRHYGLKPGSTVFELGPAKGFVLAEFAKLGCRVFGQDVSRYAVSHCHELLTGRILLEPAPSFPWKDGQFDLVIVKDMLPHLQPEVLGTTITELVRLSRGSLFFDIECGRTAFEQQAMKDWDETHLICESPQWWHDQLVARGYHGDVHFKALITDPALPDLV
jgi:methyltransferase family protein